MLSTFKAQLELPSTSYSLGGTPVDAKARGDSLNQVVYVIDPTSTPIAGAAGMQFTVNQARRSPGQFGSNRTQVLSQVTLLDANGRPVIVSASTVVTNPNAVQGASGLINTMPFVEACVACNIGYLLNPTASATAAQNVVIADLVNLGIIP